MKLNQNSHKDFNANLYFKSLNCVDMKYEVVLAKDSVTGATIVQTLVKGWCLDNGQKVDVKLWPRVNATKKDLENLPTTFDNIEFRIGFHSGYDEETGEEVILNESEPKMTAYFKDGKWHTLSGKVHKWDEESNTYERWTNEEPEQDETEE